MVRDFDPDDAALTTTVSDMSELDAAVVMAVMEVTGEDTPEDLDEILYDVIDPDALTSLFRPNQYVEISFEFNECLVSVDNEGHLAVAHT